MTTAFVNSAASREFACNMHQIVFARRSASSITWRDGFWDRR